MKAKAVKYRKGFKTWSEDKSIELRKSLNLKPWSPMGSFDLANHLQIKITTPDNINGLSHEHIKLLNNGDHWSAIKIKTGSTFLIIHNDEHHKTRQESNIMHELAHIICGHEMPQNNFPHLGLLLRDYNEEQEKEAEYFGAALQLPRIALYYAKKDFGLDTKKIAEKFNASEVMVRYRLGVTGLLNN